MITNFKKLIWIVLVWILTANTTAYAQEVTDGNLNSWFLLLNRFNLSDKLSITNELHERTGSFLKDQGQLLIRPSLDYHFNPNLEVSFGYSFIRVNPYEPYALPIARNEHNIWEQVLLKFDVGNVHMQNRFRQENRWVNHIDNQQGEYTIQGNDYANRFRYRFVISFDIIKFGDDAQSIFFNGFDEIWFDQDSKLRPTDFTRNWLYLGLGYKFNNTTNFQTGFMHQYDKTGTNNYISTPIVQFTLQKNFTL